jgi:hypothetical protein
MGRECEMFEEVKDSSIQTLAENIHILNKMFMQVEKDKKIS